jgi:hypothetical protein
MNFEKGFDFTQNIDINKKLTRKWRDQFETRAKQTYIRTRRNEKIPKNLMVFPERKNISDDWLKFG